MDVLADLAEALVEQASDAGSGRALLGIAGVPGAGKSTLAEALVAEVAARRGAGWVAQVPMDGFHLADAQLERIGLRDRKGAPPTFDARGYAALLRRLREDIDRDVYAPGFERALEQPLAGAVVVPAGVRLVVTEGNYLLLEGDWAEARAALDAVWFVEGDDALRRQRLVARHVEFGKSAEHAEAWVAAVDDRNTELVRAAAGGADRVVLAVDDGWVTQSDWP
ncbi:MAG: nucleoside/nucleotide kinase family protein [Micrococcales bacterium]|nr:nucleoside/nucleotide kinase family protein [Micrococcales bacterium]